MAEPGVRWYRWGGVWVVVVRGDADIDAAANLSRTLARLQRDLSVFVDLWDVTFIDPVCLDVLVTAKRRAESTRWDFAVIAGVGGIADQAIEEAGLRDVLRPFATRHDARAALRS